MRRRFGADLVLAVMLPAACALALLLLHPDTPQPHGRPPVTSPLSTASLVCPSALPGGTDQLGVSVLGADPEGRVAGDVQVGLGDSTGPLAVRSGRVALAPPEPGPAVVTGAGDLAPGLVAGRSRSAPLSAVDCGPPEADQWFSGAGSGATHDSVVELVNPNAGTAIADITVRSPQGVLDVPALRGVSVPGRSSVSLDLGQITPLRRAELSLEVHTSRGRLAVHVVDGYDELGAGARSQDWLPSQSEPATANVLLGLTKGAGERTLVLANPGADEVRAKVLVITPSSVYAPSGVDPVRVAPDTTAAVTLDDVLTQAAKDGAVGVLVQSDGPLTAALRQVVDGDLSLLTSAPTLDAPAAAVLPAGPKHLLVGGSDAAGVATVTSYSADGTQVDQQRLDLSPEAGADLALPDDATLVMVRPEQPLRAAVLLTGSGAAAVPVRELVLTGLVPDVRPGIP